MTTAAHSPWTLIRQAQRLYAMRRRAQAMEVARAAWREAEQDAASLDALGTFFSHAGEQHLALQAYDRALQLAPGTAPYLFNRATVRRFLGLFAAAEADYDQVIAADPRDFEAYKNRSDLRRQLADSNHVPELERLLRDGVEDWRGEVQLRYALAKEYEDLAQYEQSWSQLEQGAGLRRVHLQYDVAHDIATVDWIIEAFPTTDGTAGGCTSREPIFIVGLPRSGTTLVERILGSHSQVYPAGELDELAHAIVAAASTAKSASSTPAPRRELIAHCAQVDFTALGQDYLARARPQGRATPRFTDKMPLNYLYCGIIRRALPHARIVHVTRHPLALCHAMYKTLFKAGYPFSYDLEEIGRYYLGYRKLMRHWHTTLSGAIHEISYERLVRDQVGETRRLLEFCGLPWEADCLEFHRQGTPTTTASATQVRAPLYDSSLELWRRYETQLQPLRRQLAAAGLDIES